MVSAAHFLQTGCTFFQRFFSTSIAKVNSGRSIPKAEVTLANSQAEVTLANFYISVLFHAIV